MRVFLFISKDGDSFPLAQRVVEEGHRVVFYINSPGKRKVGDNIIEKSTIRDSIVSKDGEIDESIIKYILYPKPDCVVFDTAGEGFGKLADVIRAQGYPVIGLSQWCNQVELDIRYRDKMLNMQGIHPWLGNRGIELSTTLWFNGTNVLGVNHAMEAQTLMEGGIGPNAGCMGDAVWIGTQDSNLYKEGLGKMVPILKRLGYRGCLTLKSMVTKDRLYGIEFNSKSSYTFLELYNGRLNDLLYGVASGVLKTLSFKDGWAVGVTICIEPYPMDVETELTNGTPIRGVNKNNSRHIWFYDVCKKDNTYVSSGNGGRLGTVTARSLKGHTKDEYTVREAKRRAYRTLSNLGIKDLMYRRDIGLRVERDWGQLKEWGWL